MVHYVTMATGQTNYSTFNDEHVDHLTTIYPLPQLQGTNTKMESSQIDDLNKE